MKKLFRILRIPLHRTEREQVKEERERALTLASAGEHPIFKAVLSFMDEHARNEHETALLPNLTNEQRQFNAGRSAAAYDLAAAMRTYQQACEAKLKREKGKE